MPEALRARLVVWQILDPLTEATLADQITEWRRSILADGTSEGAAVPGVGFNHNDCL